MEDRQTFLSLELFLMNPKCPLSIFFSYSLFLAFCSSVQCSATQLCPTLLQPNGCSLPSSSVNGISQARILECVAISYSRGSSQPRDWTHVSCISCIDRQILNPCATWEAWGSTWILVSHKSLSTQGIVLGKWPLLSTILECIVKCILFNGRVILHCVYAPQLSYIFFN